MAENKDSADIAAMRHSLAHIMAAAIQEIWPDAKFGVGPVIEDGFYYDVDLGKHSLTEDNLPKIEKTMAKIIKANVPFEQFDLNVNDAIKWANKHKQSYKAELLQDLQQKGTTAIKDAGDQSLSGAKVDSVSFYRTGKFEDLCRGPHVKSTGEVVAFKLHKIAGAYWRGDEKKPMLTRIYGAAFATQKELDEYFERLEAAKKNDHRVLGQQMDLFTFSDVVGAGLPLYTPRGAAVRNALRKALMGLSKKYGGLEVAIPHVGKIDLYETSGHKDKFENELFWVKSHYDQEFVLKPVNCPHHIQIYKASPRSYRDLPLPYFEFTTQYRDEKPGEIGGLGRTRGFTVDDGHIFCTPDQIKEQLLNLCTIVREFYSSLGMYGDHWVSLSLRDPQDPDKYLGESADWDKAEAFLAQVNKQLKLDAKVQEGEAAIYGPKLDFMFKDVYGHDIQLATIQLDFAMPKRFGMTYTDADGKEKTPVMIHRAIAGSFERFFLMLIEKLGGNFPIWLAPEQVRVLNLNDTKTIVEYTEKVVEQIKEAGLRVESDMRNESVGKKIRDAEVMKVPYVLVIGEKEVKSGKVIPRVRKDIAVEHAEQTIGLEQFIQTVVNEVKSHVHHSSL